MSDEPMTATEVELRQENAALRLEVAHVRGTLSLILERAINPPILLDSDAHLARLSGIEDTHAEYNHVVFNIYRRKS